MSGVQLNLIKLEICFSDNHLILINLKIINIKNLYDY
jgi:hypothetical protein